MDNNFVDVAALISEFRTQMDIIRSATAVVDEIIGKLVKVNFVPVPPPSTASKRKNDDILNPGVPKKQCQTTQLHSNPSSSTTLQPLSLTDLCGKTRTNAATFDHDFEFNAVKPLKKVFLSRLPVGVDEEMLKRHILKRHPECIDSISISMLNRRKNAEYVSALVSVGRNDDFFNAVNHVDFWPPSTIVHQHRPNKGNHGFRSQRRSGGRRY